MSQTPERTETLLPQAVAPADHDARTRRFVGLLMGCERSLHGYILALIPHLADADEVMQETSLQLWEHFDSYDPSREFVAWARTIAYRQACLFYRKSSRVPRMSSQFLETVAARAEERAADLDERQHALADCLGKLSDTKRDLIKQYYAGGMTLAQVAETTNRTTAAVQKALERTRVALHDCIERAMRREERGDQTI